MYWLLAICVHQLGQGYALWTVAGSGLKSCVLLGALVHTKGPSPWGFQMLHPWLVMPIPIPIPCTALSQGHSLMLSVLCGRRGKAAKTFCKLSRIGKLILLLVACNRLAHATEEVVSPANLQCAVYHHYTPHREVGGGPGRTSTLKYVLLRLLSHRSGQGVPPSPCE